MAEKNRSQSTSGDPRGEEWYFRLYVAGGAPNSLRAVSHLKSILDQYIPGRYKLEIMDVVQNPLSAIRDGVIVTPTLFKLFPAPIVKIMGDLDDEDQVLEHLGLRSDSQDSAPET